MKVIYTILMSVNKGRSILSLFIPVLLVLILNLLLPANTSAQIPGFIVQKATNAGEKVLDPNTDGYTSKTTSGFIVNDVGVTYSEIPYRLFPQVLTEPHSDLKTGGSTNFTDLMKDPWYAYFDGTNFMFRVRVGNNSSASKGFSVLIDANNTFAGTGTNPGFEYEVLLATNFDVRIINLANNTTIYTASHLTNSQRSVALSATNSNPDYFIDFFVPVSGFNGAITAATPLRLSGISVTSAQSGITGTVADVGGVNDLDYLDRNQIWNAVINSFTPTSMNDILNGGFKPAQSTPPVVNGPISATDATISGTSVEAAGTIISVYQNNNLLGTTTVTAAGTWSLAVAAATLTTNGNITAKAKNGTEGLSSVSNTVIIAQGTCSAPPPMPTLGVIPNNSKNIPVTIANTTTSSFYLNIYRISATGPVLVTTSPALTAGTTTWTYTGTLPTNGEHYADAVYVNNPNCISPRSNSQCTGNSTKTLTAPTFSTTGITTATKSITINTTASTYNTLFADGIEIAEATASGTSLTFSNLSLKSGQVLSVKISSDASCGATSANVTVNRVGPVIIGVYCAVAGGSTLTFTGTSTEIGSTIRLYNAGGTQLTPTTTVNANGVWLLTVSGITPGNYYARSTAADGSGSSVNSNAITVTSQTATTGLTINAPINESAGSNGTVSGNAPAGATVKVYIDGTLLGTTTVQSTGTWSITGLSPLELYLGGLITATVTNGGLCESNLVNGTVVQCATPPTAVSASFSAATISVCNEGTVTATVANSEVNVAYQLTLNGVATGNITMGNGSSITVVSGPITAGGTLRIIARKNFAASCQTTLSASATVSLISPVPVKPVIAATASQVCYSSSTTINITSGLVANDTYQLKKDGILVGTAQTYTSGALSFNTGAITATTIFAVVHKNTSGCSTTSDAVTVSPQSPSATQLVTVNKPSVCLNETVTINVETEYGGATTYTYQVFQSINGGTATQVGATLTGNGLVQSVTTPALTTAGTYTYSVRVTGGTCSFNLVQTQTVRVGQSLTTASVGNTQTACYSTTLTGNQPTGGIGTWTVESKPANAPNPTFLDVNQHNTLVAGLTSGAYIFRWTITQTCGNGTITSSSALLTVNANCPTTYNANSPYFINGYDNLDVLAFAYDTEGFKPNVTNFTLTSGILPGGVSLNATTGEIFVSNSTLLSNVKSYNHNLTITATDALNNTTINIPVTLFFYPAASQTSMDNNPYTVLPVELLYFKVKQINGEVNLIWATATETENKGFEIEKSQDGKIFRKIGQVAGAGNSLELQKYTFRDRTVLAGTVYYRLKQVDFMGTYTYSAVAALKADANNQPQLLAYPNPTKDKITLVLQTPATEKYNLEIRDLAGKLVLTEKAIFSNQTDELVLNLQHLPAGTYLVSARSEASVLVTRIIKN
ncbi:MAG: T9SS type A sorting domain-containing protein [Adhaeribacter sp.]